jgi:MFS family permease
LTSSPSISKPLKPVLVLTIFMFAAFNLILTALQSFVLFVSSDPSALGTSFGIFTLLAFLFRFVSGRLLEQNSTMLMLAVGQITLSFALICYAVSGTILHIYIVRALHGVAWALATVAIMTVVVQRSPPSRVGEGLGYYNMVTSSAMMVFPAVGSALVAVGTRDAYGFLFVVACILNLTAGAVAFSIWHADSSEHPSSTKPATGLISRPSLRPTLSIFLLSLGFGAVLSYSPAIALIHHVDNPGLYFTWFAGTMMLGYGIGGTLSDRRGHGSISALGCGSMAVGLLAAALGDSPLTYAISACALGFGLSVANVALNALCSLVVTDSEEARAMATYSAGMDGGIMVGSFGIAILLYAGFGLPVILLMLAGLSVVTVLNTPSLRRMETMSKERHTVSESAEPA